MGMFKNAGMAMGFIMLSILRAQMTEPANRNAEERCLS